METVVTKPVISNGSAGAFAASVSAGDRYLVPASDVAQTGLIPESEAKLVIVALKDLEAAAEKVMPAYAFAYVSGGAGDEWTMRENRGAFDRWVICPNSLAGHKDPALQQTNV